MPDQTEITLSPRQYLFLAQTVKAGRRSLGVTYPDHRTLKALIRKGALYHIKKASIGRPSRYKITLAAVKAVGEYNAH